MNSGVTTGGWGYAPTYPAYPHNYCPCCGRFLGYDYYQPYTPYPIWTWTGPSAASVPTDVNPN